jgi:hypothetical protein
MKSYDILKVYNILVRSIHYVTVYVIICSLIVIENARVNSAVRTETLNKIQANFRLKL